MEKRKVVMKEKLNVVQKEQVPVEDHQLTPDQEKLLPELFAARDKANAANKVLKAITETAGLPRFEGKTVNVRFIGRKGMAKAVCEVRHREAYQVLAGWTNKLVALK